MLHHSFCPLLRFGASRVGPGGEGAHVEHGVPPGVDAQINGQDPDDVQHEAGSHLEEHITHFTIN